jgi:CHASE3 domain sensor protein
MMYDPKSFPSFSRPDAMQEAQKRSRERVKQDFAASQLPGSRKRTALLVLLLLILVGVLLVFWFVR